MDNKNNLQCFQPHLFTSTNKICPPFQTYTYVIFNLNTLYIYRNLGSNYMVSIGEGDFPVMRHLNYL